MITYNIKLQFSSEQDKTQLKDLLSLNKDIWNSISHYIHKNQTLNEKLVHDDNYYQSKILFPQSQAQIIIRAIKDVISAYRTARSNKISWEFISEKEPFVKKQLSMRLDKRLFTMNQTQIKLSTLIKNKRITCQFMLYDKVQEMFKLYPFADPLIFEREGEFFLSVTFRTPDLPVEGTKILSIDVGERRFVTNSNGECLAGKDLADYKRKTRFLRRTFQSMRTKSKSNSHSMRKKLKRAKRRERNYTKNYVHHVANEILTTDADVIVLEDLDGIKFKNQGKDRNRKRNQYPWKELRDILTYKAVLVGKRVETVNPYNTSKDDHRGLSAGVRKGCRYYASDGVVFDADWQGAINSGLRYSTKAKLPLSFSVPLDGRLNFRGRLSQEPIVLDSFAV